jgi:hypothetical protein
MKLKIEESDWNAIYTNQTGLSQMNEEILNYITKMLLIPEIQIIITISGKDEFLLSLNINKSFVEKIPLGK